LLKRQPYVPPYLAALIVETVKSHSFDECSRVIPVPLHVDRVRARGFNQALLLARLISKALVLPLDEVSLVRRGSSEKYRAGLDAKGRQDTVIDAFAVVRPRLVEGEDILLVDDVFTTGATASACADVLLASGARNVFVVTIARPAW
jgi:ComF family protein